MALNTRRKIKDSLATFAGVREKTHQLLTALNYRYEGSVVLNAGTWEIYTKKDFVFPYFNPAVKTSVDKFVAFYKGKKQFIAYGSFDEFPQIEENLKAFYDNFIAPGRRILGIPVVLTAENAQDFGYIRGLLLGIFLLVFDLAYAAVFKLKNSILTGFMDFIRLVYEGNPGLAIGVGIVVSGLYFGFLLIFLPILYGQLCVRRAEKIEQQKEKSIQGEFLEYEYGTEAENSLEEEYRSILEERRKQEIYEEITKIWPAVTKNEFELLYQRLVDGFFSPERLYEFLQDSKRMSPDIDLEKFLQIIVQFRQSQPQVEIKFKP